jgi:heme/copper-type cytochrome/quinol oxidase subunit 4
MLTRRRLCLAVLGLAAVETLFWLYTFYYVDRHANPLGNGLELIALVPMTMIFLMGVLPALALVCSAFAFRLRR